MRIADKLSKVNEAYTVTMVDNGFLFEIGGRDEEGDWSNAKFIVADIDDLILLVREASELPRDS
jgi:hypothetical protein